jgi:CubicO group peptidase (beta-lactamase class C family)
VAATGLGADDLRISAALELAIERGETGIQAAAYLGNELIVDAGAGTRNGSDPVLPSTLFQPFSITKAVTATAVTILVSRGLISCQDRIVDYWPEYGANGKQDTTLRDVLSHRSGLPWMPPDVTPERQADWDWMVDRLANMTPVFAPNTRNTYHPMTWGWIVGEVIRRVDPEHRPVQDFFTEEIIEPLKITDMYFGLPDSEFERTADLIGGGQPAYNPEFAEKAMPSPIVPSARVYNERLARQTINPSAGMIANAGSIARLFAMLANRGELDGVRLLPAEMVEGFLEPRDNAEDPEALVGIVYPLSAYGYWLSGSGDSTDPIFGENPQLIGHHGAGGSLAWAELDTRLAVSICHNRMHDPVPFAEHPFEPITTAIRAVARERRGA